MKSKKISIFLCVVMIAAVFAVGGSMNASAETTFTLTDLGTFGGSWSWTWDINNLGHVVGMSQNTDNDNRAFLWTEEDGMIDLGTLGEDIAQAFGINDLGQVVGRSVPTGGRWDHAFLWTEEDGMIDLLPGYYYSNAWDINNLGHVVGNCGGPFLWTEEGGMIYLGSLGGGSGLATAINDHDWVVGKSQAITGYHHAFLWTPEDGMIDLGTLGGPTSAAQDINNLGHVVGESETASGKEHGFLWTEEDGMINLGPIGSVESWAASINDKGQIVGSYWTESGDGYGFLLEDGIYSTLPTFPGGTYSWPEKINEHGQIAGDGDIASGDIRPALWTITTPAPEEILDSIRDEIGSLVGSSELGEGHGTALLAKIGAAEHQLEKGNPNAPIKILEAFINQIEALDNAGKISPEDATALINLVNDAIAGLNDGT